MQPREEVKGIMDMRRKKKKKTTTLEEEEEEGGVVVVGPIIMTRDPLEVFGMDLMTKILSYLNASSVASSTVVSRHWHAVASSDRLWSSMCDELWVGKAHIPRLSQMRGLSKFAAYSLAVTDGKRARIRRDDLCDHAWEFRFTKTLSTVSGQFLRQACHEIDDLVLYLLMSDVGMLEEVLARRDFVCSRILVINIKTVDRLRLKRMSQEIDLAAPEYWRNLDPYWSGVHPLMHRYFHQDGSSSADPDDKVWGGHDCSFSIVTSLVGEGEIRSHYVRMNRWSTLSIQRKNDWSWEMSNNLCCYSSLPDAQKEGGTGPLFMFL